MAAGLVTAVANICSGGNHGTLTVTAPNGASVTLDRDVLDAGALSSAEWTTFMAYAVRALRFQKGVSLASFLNRVLVGDEATNVKVYHFFGPGAAITKTNIGTAYINICAGSNGEPIVADFTGCTEYRVRLYANLIGTGQWGARILRVGTSDVLHDAPNLGAAGERALDTDWQTLPVAFQGQGILELVAQGKSQTAADDPVFRFMAVGLR